MTVLEFIVYLVVAGVCGAIARALGGGTGADSSSRFCSVSSAPSSARGSRACCTSLGCSVWQSPGIRFRSSGRSSVACFSSSSLMR